MPSSESKPVAGGSAHADVDLTRPQKSGAAANPNERDQQVGSTDGVPSGAVQQGAKDLKRGLQDTSRGTEADQAYKQQR